MRSEPGKWPLILVSVVAVSAIAAAALVAVEHEETRREVARLREDLDALRERTREPSVPPDVSADVARRVAEAAAYLDQRAIEREARRSPDEGARRAGDEPSESAAGSGERRPPALTYEESMTQVLDTYDGESPDPGWSRSATEQLDASIRGNLPAGSRLESLECRATMCQIEVAHQDRGAPSKLLASAFRHWPGSILVAKEADEAGDLKVTLIASRQGTEPPLGSGDDRGPGRRGQGER